MPISQTPKLTPSAAESMSKATIEKYKSQVEKLTEENEEVQLHLQIDSLYLNNSKRNIMLKNSSMLYNNHWQDMFDTLSWKNKSQRHLKSAKKAV